MIKLTAGAMLALGMAGPALAQDTPPEQDSPIIVTGTRETGLRAIDSPAPVQVLDSATLDRAGSRSRRMTGCGTSTTPGASSGATIP